MEWSELIEYIDQEVKKFESQKGEFLKLLDNFDVQFKTPDFRELNTKMSALRKRIMELKSIKENKGETPEINKEISELNKGILALKNQMQENKINILNTSFAKKVITSEKSDIEKARKIIIKAKSINAEILESVEKDITNTSGILSEELHDFLKIYKPLGKLSDHFTRINKFIIDYSGKLRQLAPDKSNFIIIKTDLEKLEKKEMLASLKETRDTYNRISPQINPSYKEELLKLFNKQTVKITKLTTASDTFPPGEYILKTPFGDVKVLSTARKELMIYPPKGTVAPSYDTIVFNLDKLFENQPLSEKTISDITSELIDPIIKYLKQKVSVQDIKQIFASAGKSVSLQLTQDKCQELLNKIIPCSPTSSEILNGSQKICAAVLCGILMLSESHDIRNPTFGKLERNAIRNVKYLSNLAQKGCINPFEKTFSNKIGRYVPSHDATSDANLSDIESASGGRKQTQLVLGCIVDVDENIHIPKTSLPENFTGNSKKIIENIFKIIDKNEDLKLQIFNKWDNCTDQNGFRTKFNSSNTEKIKKCCIEIIELLNSIKSLPKNITGNDMDNLHSNFRLLKFQKQINSASDKNKFNNKVQKDYVRIIDLPSDESFDKFNFGGILKTPRKFFGDQVIKNMKKLYKIQNRTLTTTILRQLK